MLRLISLFLVAFRAVQAVTMEAVEIFSRVNCAGTPDILAMYNVSTSCVEDTCSDINFGNGTYYMSRTCNVSDRFVHTKAVFGDFTYVIMETYDNDSCNSFGEADVFLASGSCEVSSGFGDQSVITSLFSNGSAVVALYPNDACGGEPSLYFELDQTALATGSNSGSESDGSSLGVGAIVGIAVGVLVAVFLVVLCLRCRKKRDAEASLIMMESNNSFSHLKTPQGLKNEAMTDPGSLESTYDNHGSTKPTSLVGLWDDEVIATARIPREKVVIEEMISRGGGGEVYLGLFNQQQVAVKMLLPEMRKSVRYVNAFLAEVKLMATLDHPRIVQFVGVAWDSLTDLCVVSEFMEGGDLRSLLVKYEKENHPTGFDKTKVTIALHVAHALTYLHSLETPVLHRDLKSKNVLLTPALEAKLTDFGISREQADKTMTSGVGTLLWMAPEVMLGERYDAKADMFSFGVLLSELDVHVLPYSHAKEKSESDRKIPESVMLQMVALGKIRVEFSSNSLESVLDLGLACVSLDPQERPTAAQALYRLHSILTQEL